MRANIAWKMKWKMIGDIIPMGKLEGIDPGGFEAVCSYGQNPFASYQILLLSSRS